jgi:hypothetical protein
MQRTPSDLSRSDRRFLWSWTAGIVAVHGIILLVLILSHPGASEWIAQAVQAEFVGGPPPVIVPVRIARPGGLVRIVMAHQSVQVDPPGDAAGSSSRKIGAAFDPEFHVDQFARMIHVGLCHQECQVLAPQRGQDLRQSLGKRWRNSLERFVEQQTFGADGERAAERHQLLLAAAEQ